MSKIPENEERRKFQKVENDKNPQKDFPKSVKHPFPDASEYKLKKRTPYHVIHQNDIYVFQQFH
jgi:hypothetical protein